MDTHRALSPTISDTGHDVEGKPALSFGEYLIERVAIDRFQLLQALQMQDRNPGTRLGECIAALGFLPYTSVQGHLNSWHLYKASPPTGPRS